MLAPLGFASMLLLSRSMFFAVALSCTIFCSKSFLVTFFSPSRFSISSMFLKIL